MNKLRSQFVYKLIGQIHGKKPRQNPKHSQYFYQLNIICQNQPHIQKIFAFKDKIPAPLWQIIDEGNCFQQKYKFFCRNYSGHYYLVDWEKLDHEN